VLLAGLGCCATGPAAAAEQRAADVTITVVEDPEQLKEKVNTISLPDADDVDEEPHTERKSGHRNESDKNSNDPGDPQHDDATEVNDNAGDKAQSAAEAAKSDLNEAKQQSTDSHNDSNQ
jgi:hypothetical protein